MRTIAPQSKPKKGNLKPKRKPHSKAKGKAGKPKPKQKKKANPVKKLIKKVRARPLSKQDAQKIHAERPKRARTADERHTSKQKATDHRWRLQPEKYDYPGVDTPDRSYNPWTEQKVKEQKSTQFRRRRFGEIRKNVQDIKKDLKKKKPDLRKKKPDELRAYHTHLTESVNRMGNELAKYRNHTQDETDKKIKAKNQKQINKITSDIQKLQKEREKVADMRYQAAMSSV